MVQIWGQSSEVVDFYKCTNYSQGVLKSQEIISELWVRQEIAPLDPSQGSINS